MFQAHSLSFSPSFFLQEVKGCFKALVNLIEENAVLLGGVALGIGALEVSNLIV